MVREIRLNQVRKLGVNIQWVRDLRHASRLLVLLLALALPELLLLRLARGGAAVEGGAGAVGEEGGFGGRGAVVGGEDGLACIAQHAHGAEVELAEAVGVALFVG